MSGRDGVGNAGPEDFAALREIETEWLIDNLSESIANLSYPVGCGDSPTYEHLKFAAERLFDRYAKMIEMARNAGAPAQASWQPIETAPKDGSKVDLWITPPKGALTTGDYGRVSDCWFSAGKWWLYDESKYASDSANCRSEIWNVTHWMARPTPPLSSTDCGGGK